MAHVVDTTTMKRNYERVSQSFSVGIVYEVRRMWLWHRKIWKKASLITEQAQYLASVATCDMIQFNAKQGNHLWNVYVRLLSLCWHNSTSHVIVFSNAWTAAVITYSDCETSSARQTMRLIMSWILTCACLNVKLSIDDVTGHCDCRVEPSAVETNFSS